MRQSFIRAVVVDDHQLVREGLCSLLRHQEDMQVVGEAGDGRDAVRLVRECLPDVVIMDVTMPGLNGIEATRQILAECRATRVLALSAHGNRGAVTSMLDAGASGFVLKDCAFAELAHAIRTVVRDHVYLSPPLADVLVGAYVSRSSEPPQPRGPALTAREREVLQLLAEGVTTKETAARLHVSAKTVETHRRRIMQKLRIDGIAGLTKYAIREGLTSLER